LNKKILKKGLTKAFDPGIIKTRKEKERKTKC